MRKQSYYVWFLGAKESRGLRGLEYITPVLQFLLEREREIEPAKVTLQVSSKGIKMVQNVSRGRGKLEQVKHFVPHHAVTCAHQEEDVVCAILLLYNPLTHCPVHVHAYRCDSSETAAMLCSQLQQLAQRPENQSRFRQIEQRLAVKGLLPEPAPSLQSPPVGIRTRLLTNQRPLASDGRTEDGSDRTEESSVPLRKVDNRGLAALYDSLAAELREKLGNPEKGPILLPPRDYDTVRRRHGDLKDMEHRRCTQLELVGAHARETGSSGKSSSGIGSEETHDVCHLDEEERPQASRRRNILHDPRFRALQQHLAPKLRQDALRTSVPEPTKDESRFQERPVRWSTSPDPYHRGRESTVAGARRKDYRHSFAEVSQRVLPF